MTQKPSDSPSGQSSNLTVSTILAFDFGLRRIGVAVGNTMINSANPLTTLHHTDSGADWVAINKVIQEWQPSLIIVGLPCHVDGTLSKNAEQVKEFAAQLEEHSGRSVLLVDEKLSTTAAKDEIKAGRKAGTHKRTKSGDIDKIAAQVILRTWLNEHHAR